MKRELFIYLDIQCIFMCYHLFWHCYCNFLYLDRMKYNTVKLWETPMMFASSCKKIDKCFDFNLANLEGSVQLEYCNTFLVHRWLWWISILICPTVIAGFLLFRGSLLSTGDWINYLYTEIRITKIEKSFAFYLDFLIFLLWQ